MNKEINIKSINEGVCRILVDTDFNLTSIFYYKSKPWDQKYTTISDIKETLNKYDEIHFTNLNIKKSENGEKLIINSYGNHNGQHYNIGIGIDKNSIHPLEKKYGTNGLKLRKIVYRDKEEAQSFMSKIDLFEAVKTTYFYIEYVEFDITSSSKEEQSVLRLSAKDLYKYIIMMQEVYYERNGSASSSASVSADFYTNSGLSLLKVHLGLPLLKVNEETFRKEHSDIILEQSTEYQAQLNKWKNKMFMSGQQIGYDETTLISYEGESKVLPLPNFLSIDQEAFIKSSVKEIILTSPVTIAHPGILFNKHNQEIQIATSYENTLASLDEEGPFYSILFRQSLENFPIGIFPYLKNITMNI